MTLSQKVLQYIMWLLTLGAIASAWFEADMHFALHYILAIGFVHVVMEAWYLPWERRTHYRPLWRWIVVGVSSLLTIVTLTAESYGIQVVTGDNAVLFNSLFWKMTGSFSAGLGTVIFLDLMVWKVHGQYGQ